MTIQRDIKELLRHSEWKQQGDIVTGSIISCEIDGKKIEAKVSISPKELAVKLISEKINLKSYTHLPLMAPVLFTYEPCKGSSANKRGLARLHEMLVALYHDYLIIQESEQEIKTLIPLYNKLKQDFHRSMERLSHERAEAKRVFKEGLLDQNTYMRIVSDIRKRCCSLHTQYEKDFNKIFSGILGECKCCDNLMRIIEDVYC